VTTTAVPLRARVVGGQDLGIEALRGLAALMVVFTHYAYLVSERSGWLGVASTGVDLFFVLSGFVFAPYLHDERWPVLPHLVRRLFRLYPLYLVALLVYVALRLPSADAWEHFGVHLLMMHTLQSREIAFFYNPAFWSLPPEVEFYLLLPLLARLVCRVGWHAVFWPALALRLVLGWPTAPEAGEVTWLQIASVHLPGLLVEFLLGAWAWRVVVGRASLPRVPALVLGLLVLGLTVALYVAVVVDPASTPWGRWASVQVGLVAAAGYAGIVVAVAAAHRTWQRHARAAAVAAWAGHLSYGVYLLHNAAPPVVARLMPSLDGASAAAASLVLTFAAAALAHAAVERPMRAWGRRLSRALALPSRS
jgi:peptidoglycan/LPS O-acetylase OafA/YrhL